MGCSSSAHYPPDITNLQAGEFDGHITNVNGTAGYNNNHKHKQNRQKNSKQSQQSPAIQQNGKAVNSVHFSDDKNSTNRHIEEEHEEEREEGNYTYNNDNNTYNSRLGDTDNNNDKSNDNSNMRWLKRGNAVGGGVAGSDVMRGDVTQRHQAKVDRQKKLEEKQKRVASAAEELANQVLEEKERLSLTSRSRGTSRATSRTGSPTGTRKHVPLRLQETQSERTETGSTSDIEPSTSSTSNRDKSKHSTRINS